MLLFLQFLEMAQQCHLRASERGLAIMILQAALPHSKLHLPAAAQAKCCRYQGNRTWPTLGYRCTRPRGKPGRAAVRAHGQVSGWCMFSSLCVTPIACSGSEAAHIDAHEENGRSCACCCQGQQIKRCTACFDGSTQASRLHLAESHPSSGNCTPHQCSYGRQHMAAGQAALHEQDSPVPRTGLRGVSADPHPCR